VLILSDLHTCLKFEDIEFVPRKGAGEASAPGPNETTVDRQATPLTCPLNPTPIGRLAFPAGDRENKKGGKEAAATGGIRTFTQKIEYQMRYSKSRNFWAQVRR